MAPPAPKGPSSWDVYEPSHEANHLPPPPAYSEYDTAPSTPRQPRHSRPSNLPTSHYAEFTDESPSEPVIAEPPEIETSEPERQLIGHVSPYVEDFLGKVGLRYAPGPHGPSKYRADLYLVPEDAIPAGEDWQLSGADYLKQNCDQLQLTRVATPNVEKLREGGREGKCACGCLPTHNEKQSRNMVTDGPSSSSQMTDDLHKDLWWRNEAQARWLAEWLGRELRSTQPSSHRLGKSRQIGDNNKTCGCACHYSSNNNSRLRNSAEGVEVTVRTEEMAFRRETDMGLWESNSGWTIIVSAITR